LTNLKGAFLADPEVKGKVILLIDDVRTSGGTVNACAEALKKADAAEVKVLTFCGNHEDPDSWAVSF
jgi:predicted amidophosphoribosyltransferase